MRRCIYKKIHYLTFDLDLGVKVTRNVTQYPLHHVIYAPTKFQVATSNGLGEDTITRNVTDGRTDRQTHGRTDGRTTDRLWYEINIPYFSYEKAGIIFFLRKSGYNYSSCGLTRELLWERSGSVVECLTQDRGAAGSSLTGVTALSP